MTIRGSRRLYSAFGRTLHLDLLLVRRAVQQPIHVGGSDEVLRLVFQAVQRRGDSSNSSSSSSSRCHFWKRNFFLGQRAENLYIFKLTLQFREFDPQVDLRRIYLVLQSGKERVLQRERQESTSRTIGFFYRTENVSDDYNDRDRDHHLEQPNSARPISSNAITHSFVHRQHFPCHW